MQCWHKDGGQLDLKYLPPFLPPFCHERLAGDGEVWSARAGGWDEWLFGDQGCWGSAETMRRPSLARKPARYSTLALGASTLTPLVHGQGADSD